MNFVTLLSSPSIYIQAIRACADMQFTASSSWAVLSAPPPAPLPGSVLSIALQELSLALTDDLCFKALYHEILRLSLTDITAEVRPRSSCTV